MSVAVVPQPDRVLIGLGKALRARREERALSQEQLSLEPASIGGIERGERSPTVVVIAKLADTLGVSLSDLYGHAEGIDR